VQSESLRPALSGAGYEYLLIACVAVIFCFAQGAPAQSGRHVKKSASSPPPIVDPQTIEATSRISKIIIGGHDIDTETKEYYSNWVSSIVDACTERLRERPGSILQFINGGKMTSKEAAERAKHQTDAYVLWFGYRTSLVDLHEVIDYVDYFVLMPQSAKTLTEGRVYIGQQKTTIDRGGVMRVPRVPRRQRQSISRQLDEAGHEIADRVREKL
jgi:hypothetical protein